MEIPAERPELRLDVQEKTLMPTPTDLKLQRHVVPPNRLLPALPGLVSLYASR